MFILFNIHAFTNNQSPIYIKLHKSLHHANAFSRLNTNLVKQIKRLETKLIFHEDVDK